MGNAYVEARFLVKLPLYACKTLFIQMSVVRHFYIFVFKWQSYAVRTIYYLSTFKELMIFLGHLSLIIITSFWEVCIYSWVNRFSTLDTEMRSTEWFTISWLAEVVGILLSGPLMNCLKGVFTAYGPSALLFIICKGSLGLYTSAPIIKLTSASDLVCRIQAVILSGWTFPWCHCWQQWIVPWTATGHPGEIQPGLGLAIVACSGSRPNRRRSR